MPAPRPRARPGSRPGPAQLRSPPAGPCWGRPSLGPRPCRRRGPIFRLMRSGIVRRAASTWLVPAATACGSAPLTTTLIELPPVMLCWATCNCQPGSWRPLSCPVSLTCSVSRSTLGSSCATTVALFAACPVNAAVSVAEAGVTLSRDRCLGERHFAVLKEPRLHRLRPCEDIGRRRAGRRGNGDLEVLLRASVEELRGDVRDEEARARRPALRRCRSRPSTSRGCAGQP